MTIDVKKYVEGCDPCQRFKTTNNVLYGLLQPIAIPSEPWSVVAFDFIVNLPPSKDQHGILRDSIMVVVDKSGKRTRLIECNKDLKAPGIAQLFYHEIFKHHGVPIQTICD